MQIPRMLSTSILIAMLSGTAAAQEAQVADRSDAARSYMVFERAFADHTPSDPTRVVFINRQIDWMARLVFRDQWQQAVEQIDAMTGTLLSADDASAAAARATQVRSEPAVAVRGEDEAVRLILRPMYDVAGRPARLKVRVRDGDRVLLTEPFKTEGDTVIWRPREGAKAARYVVEIFDANVHAETRGAVTLLERRPSELRKELSERLDKLAPGKLELRRSLLAARSRLLSLLDEPDLRQSASILTDLAELSRDLEHEVSELEAGRDPYVNRAGDYWRHFNTIADPLMSLPARVYAPASAMKKLEAGERVPLLIALHGAGGDENLFMDGYGAGMIKDLADQEGFILVSPLTYTALTDSRSLGEMIETMSDLYAIDSDRIYVLGHSLGAVTAASWALHFADKLAGVGLIAGGGQSPEAGRIAPTFAAAAEFDRIFPAARLEALSIASRERGAEIEYRYYPGQSHVSIVSAALPDTIAWLLAHRLNSEKAVD